MYLNEQGLAAAALAEWDFIVVGSGAVGLILSVSLARANKSVLLLESGTKDTGSAQDLNNIVVTGRPHLGALQGRARTLGGTTTLWGGQLTRFVPYDLDSREIMPDCNWPIRYEDIERYYVEVASVLDLDGRYLTDESLRMAIKSNEAEGGAGCEIFYTRWLREANLSRYFASDLENHPRLAVALGCHAREILCSSEDGSRITGVRTVSAGGRGLDFRAGEVVLACGTIEISRLLLITAKKAANLQWAANRNIGRYFQDHLDLMIGQVELRNRQAFADIFENFVIEGRKYQPKIRMTTSALRELGCLNIACTLRFDSSIAEDILMVKQFFKSLLRGSRIDQPWKSLKRTAALSHLWFPLIWRYIRHRRILAMADQGISVIAHCEQRPLLDSRVMLDADKVDRFGDPIAHLHWVVDESLQMKSLQLFATQLEGYLQTECDAHFTALPALVAGDPAVLAEAIDSYHQCGGARMALSEADGVVDVNCRVFGTRNLYVAGAAVFPSASFANPTFTAMALARRLCAHLLNAETTADEMP